MLDLPWVCMGDFNEVCYERRQELKLANSVDISKSWTNNKRLKDKLDEALSVEERYWYQRAKVEWIRYGDQNTSFFHAKASTRKAPNKIYGLIDGAGHWTEVRGESNPKQDCINVVLEGVQSKLPVQLSRMLEGNFSALDVRKTDFDMSPLKAPSKNGLLAVFYQKSWDHIRMSITTCCLDVLNNSGSVKGFNSTVITLIPKIQSPKLVSNYRPISLCNVLYKVIAKVIANRFRNVLRGVISEAQCAFIPRRLISNNTIVGFECLHRLKRRKRKHSSMAIKLDMS
ncbi:hypothetical protein Ddye_009276 [Dipteronia dyeriana]|uniref:Reverse transcriptase domain-containing protein n=1 Tax=Dipteronia dyeriana TaxID=168575 RepID=A0AAD9XB37_9ROSI|nr:hypothetical protein Ddye_009276 [Dipteronia dyeriana]